MKCKKQYQISYGQYKSFNVLYQISCVKNEALSINSDLLITSWTVSHNWKTFNKTDLASYTAWKIQYITEYIWYLWVYMLNITCLELNTIHYNFCSEEKNKTWYYQNLNFALTPMYIYIYMYIYYRKLDVVCCSLN